MAMTPSASPTMRSPGMIAMPAQEIGILISPGPSLLGPREVWPFANLVCRLLLEKKKLRTAWVQTITDLRQTTKMFLIVLRPCRHLSSTVQHLSLNLMCHPLLQL